MAAGCGSIRASGLGSQTHFENWCAVSSQFLVLEPLLIAVLVIIRILHVHGLSLLWIVGVFVCFVAQC